MRELEFIQRIRESCPPGGRVRVGVGDDAAVVETPAGVVVVTTDMLVEGTHFTTGESPERIGRKAVAVSLSDVAAMGCRATAAFLAVALRRDHPDSFVAGLLAGARAVAAEYGVPLAGGDTTETTGPVVLCSTLLGEPPPGREPVLRSGARPGDALLVTGSLGGAGRERHLTFPPRLAQAAELVARWHPRAMIDLSDGLSTDARHLAEESGVSIRLIASAIPRSRAAGAEPGALAAALSDGEDFELLFTVPEEEAEPLARAGLAGTAVTRIGSVAAGPARVTLAGTDGTEEELLAGGYEHFR